MKLKGLWFFYALFFVPILAGARAPYCVEVLKAPFAEASSYHTDLYEEYASTTKERANFDLRSPVVVRLNPHGQVLANGVRVTGESKYPLLFVLTNLGLTESLLKSLPPDASIVSVGEGTSGLGPYLAARFPNTRFLDVWYNSQNLPPEMAAFVEKYKKYLLAGSSTLIPLPDRSQDLVVSHRLLNNFYDNEWAQYKSLDEMVRVLKKDGLALVEFVKLNYASQVEKLVKRLHEKYGDSIMVSIVRWTPANEPHYQEMGVEDFRIIIRRK